MFACVPLNVLKEKYTAILFDRINKRVREK
jgi:hypothetical protein